MNYGVGDASCSAQALKQLCQECGDGMGMYVMDLAEFFSGFVKVGMGGDIEDVGVGIGRIVGTCPHSDILGVLKVCLGSTFEEIDLVCNTGSNESERIVAVKKIKGIIFV